MLILDKLVGGIQIHNYHKLGRMPLNHAGYTAVGYKGTTSRALHNIDEPAEGYSRTMRSVTSIVTLAALLLVLSSLVRAQAPSGIPYLSGTLGNTTIAGNSTSNTNPDPNGKFEISSEGIRARFVPYGAAISNLFVHDKNGVERDIVLGYISTLFSDVFNDEANKKPQVGQCQLLYYRRSAPALRGCSRTLREPYQELLIHNR